MQGFEPGPGHAHELAELDARFFITCDDVRLHDERTCGVVAGRDARHVLARPGLDESEVADHDRLAGSAADLGRQGKYTDALASLDDAAQRIADARALRDELANTVDVTVLDEWLARNDDYDKALRALYTTVSNAKGKVTNAVRDAIRGEKAAKDRLPSDSRGLVVIMSEIGQGGMNGAVIAIEEARGTLVAALDSLASPTPEPAPSDDGSPPEDATDAPVSSQSAAP